MDEGMFGVPTGPWKLEKIERLGLQREPGFQYQLKETAIWRAPLDQPSQWSKLRDCSFRREEGYCYAVDLDGDIVRFKKS